jgi:hypothetical protein
MYEPAEPEGDRRQDLTGVHAAAVFERDMAATVPWRIRVRRKLDDLLVTMTQGRG